MTWIRAKACPWAIGYIIIDTRSQIAETPYVLISRIFHPLPIILNFSSKSSAKSIEAKCRDNAEKNRDWLPQTKSSREGRTSKNDRGKQAELDSIWLLILNTVTAQGIFGETNVNTQTSKAANPLLYLHRSPTVQPATMEGIEPDLAYPMMPPPATTAPII